MGKQAAENRQKSSFKIVSPPLLLCQRQIKTSGIRAQLWLRVGPATMSVIIQKHNNQLWEGGPCILLQPSAKTVHYSMFSAHDLRLPFPLVVAGFGQFGRGHDELPAGPAPPLHVGAAGAGDAVAQERHVGSIL